MISVNGLLVQVDKQNVGKVVSKIQMSVFNEAPEVDIKLTCRVCLTKQDAENLYCLFGTNGMFKEFSIASALLECFYINLKEDEQLPSSVCKQCAASTLQAYTFKRCILKCQKFLAEQKTRNNVETGEKVLEGTFFDCLDNEERNFNNERKGKVKRAKKKLLKRSTENSLLSNLPNESYPTKNVVNVNVDHSYSKKIPQEELGMSNEPDGDGMLLPLLTNDIEIKTKPLVVIDEQFALLPVKEQEVVKPKVFRVIDPEKWWTRDKGPPYNCRICEKSFGVRYKSFYVHVNLHFAKKHPCTYCGKRFRSYTLKIHIRTHTKEQPYACDRCPARFTVQANMKRHMNVHTGDIKYVCHVCGKVFAQASGLATHREIHDKKTYVCEHCGKVSGTRTKYRRHILKKHRAYKKKNLQISENKVVKEHPLYRRTCFTCGNVYKTPTALSCHVRTHTNSAFKCDVCNKKLYISYNYNIHMLYHRIESEEPVSSIDCEDVTQQWKCEICKKNFSERKELATHILTHLKKPNTCVSCNKSFTTRASLIGHQNRHTGERPYKCSKCPMAFSYAATKILHEKCHSGEKPYKCEICFRGFVQQQNLVSHMYTHTGEKKYICPFCGKGFATNGNLTVHKRRHTGETPYTCDLCDRGFYDSSSLKKHKKAQHK